MPQEVGRAKIPAQARCSQSHVQIHWLNLLLAHLLFHSLWFASRLVSLALPPSIPTLKIEYTKGFCFVCFFQRRALHLAQKETDSSSSFSQFPFPPHLKKLKARPKVRSLLKVQHIHCSHKPEARLRAMCPPSWRAKPEHENRKEDVRAP